MKKISFITSLIFCPNICTATSEINSDLACPPLKVRYVIEREAECDHWAGEDPYDADRAKQIRNAVEKLRCGELEQDKKEVKAHYQANRQIQSMLKNYDDFIAAYPKARLKWQQTMKV